jgi:nickel-type superoxide dismutase maturation protease
MRRRSGRHGVTRLLVILAFAPIVAFSRVTVVGGSMLPTLQPGDRLLVLRRGRHLRTGDLVTVTDPRDPSGRRVLVKRVVRASPAEVEVAGDNPDASTDSRTFGPVARSAVRGWVFYRYAPAARAGPVG